MRTWVRSVCVYMLRPGEGPKLCLPSVCVYDGTGVMGVMSIRGGGAYISSCSARPCSHPTTCVAVAEGFPVVVWWSEPPQAASYGSIVKGQDPSACEVACRWT